MPHSEAQSLARTSAACDSGQKRLVGRTSRLPSRKARVARRQGTISRRVTLLHRGLGVLLVALSFGPAYATLLSAAAATLQPIGMEFGEATIYGATLRILQGLPLYQNIDVPPFTVVPYTPLYYFAAAALRAIFGEGFGPGRMLSLVAGVM